MYFISGNVVTKTKNTGFNTLNKVHLRNRIAETRRTHDSDRQFIRFWF